MQLLILQIQLMMRPLNGPIQHSVNNTSQRLLHDKNRDELLHPKDGTLNQAVKKTYMTTTYNPAYDGLRSQVKKTWDLLDRLSSTRHVHGAGLQVGYRRPKNLRDLLVRSKLTPISEESEPTRPVNKTCTNRKCQYCPLLNTEGQVVATVTGRKYRTKQRDLQQQQPHLLHHLQKM